MGEYQYYEFCSLNKPLTSDARQEMYSLSSRAKVTTHGASYVYNYGDFRGNTKQLVTKYFDVFFYISKWGSIQLIFKYSNQEIQADKLKKYCVKDIIACEEKNSHILLNIDFDNEDGFGWIEGEELLPDLLPLYDEIKSGNYQFLKLVADASKVNIDNSIKNSTGPVLTKAQEAFFKYAEINHHVFYE